MLRFIRIVLFALALVAVVSTRGAAAQAAHDTTLSPVYSVAAYDPARNPAEDLKTTVALATRENRRILLKVGGNWCSWCRALDKYMHENRTVAEALRRDFVVMKVNYSEENENAAFLSQYPEIPGYPHFFVLEKDGTLLLSQGTAELEEGKGYSEAAILTFLRKWAPAR